MRLVVATSQWMMMMIIRIINFEAFIRIQFPLLLLAPLYCEKDLCISIASTIERCTRDNTSLWRLLCEEFNL
jgi:hypothetical protein